MIPYPGVRMARAGHRRGLFGAAVLLAALVGAAIGIGGFTFVYARGASYLTDDPRACANCHVMGEQFRAWQASSHRSVAACNDCHTPSSSVVAKYLVKALNGYHHSSAFTTGDFHEPIGITPRNQAVTEQQCRTCHAGLVAAIDRPGHAGGDGISCIRCHASVGHRTRD
jgi:cytochrome c nitrite reductase small subunit